jgi:hypothetical protein
MTEENLQARIRGVTLMALSNKFGSMLLTTGNKSGDGHRLRHASMATCAAAIRVLKDVYKTEVFALCRWRNAISPAIPEVVITRPPSAELRENQKDQDSLPPYEVLDEILKRYIEQDQLARRDRRRRLRCRDGGARHRAHGAAQRVQATPVGSRPAHHPARLRSRPALSDHVGLALMGERGVRCQIEEESARLVPVRHACEDFGFLLEVCDPADFDHACQLLERFDLELVAEDVEAEATDGSPPVPLVPRTSTPITVIVFLLIAAVFVLVAWF